MKIHEREKMFYGHDASAMAPCRCGRNRWLTGDQYSSNWSQNFHKCAACGICAVFIAQGTASLFIVGSDGGMAYPYREYVDRAVRPVFAIEFERLEAVREQVVKTHLLAVNRSLGLSPETRGNSVPKNCDKEWHDKLDAVYETKEWRCPQGFEGSPLPPRMPQEMLAYTHYDGSWHSINHEHTANLPIPIHPDRARHDAAYSEAFDSVRDALEVKFVPAELPNRYWNDPYESTLAPWYSFFIGPAEFTVGPRKNVIHLSVKSPLAMDVTDIVALHERDGKPTFECDSDKKNILIHAWGHQKLMDYMLALGRAARALGRGPATGSGYKYGTPGAKDRPFVVRGAVNWPTHLYDDGQGGMVVLAVVDCALAQSENFLHDQWRRAELIEPDHFGIAPERMETLLACVPLGTSDGCWWRGNPDPDKHSDADPYCPWECTMDDLTSDGRQIVRMLNELYGRPVRLVTHIDT